MSDAVLIAAGVAGFGLASDALPWLALAMAAPCSCCAMRSATGIRRCDPWQPDVVQAQRPPAWAPPWPPALAFTWLNPHVYLDTGEAVGSVSCQYDGRETASRWGAMSASFLFFFMLGFGARPACRPVVFTSPGAWRVLDALVGTAMPVLALRLFWP